ncbi:hypothetical protein ACNKHX_17675 [Shigella flexneri]
MCQQIADNVVTFLLQEMAHGRIPRISAAAKWRGNISNAVWHVWGKTRKFLRSRCIWKC